MKVNWQHVRGVVRRHWYTLRRTPHRLGDMFYWPFLDTILFGSIALFAERNGGTEQSGTVFIVGGLFLVYITQQNVFGMTLAFFEETWSRNMLNVLVTPVTELEYVLGLIIFSLLRSFLGIAVVGVVGTISYSFDITRFGWGLIPLWLLLVILAWALALTSITIVLRYGQGAEIVSWVTPWSVMALSGALYALEALPQALRAVGEVLPTTQVFVLARGLLSGNGLDGGRLAYATGGILAMLVLSVIYSTHTLRVFKARGLVTRFS